MLRSFIVLIFFGVTISAHATETTKEIASAARQWRESHGLEILNDFRDLLSLPNVSSDLQAMNKNADWIESYIARRGFSFKRLEAGGAPYIFAERLVDGAEKTILIYAHFDGQPVQAENWASEPWVPTLRNGMVEANAEVVPWPTTSKSIEPEWRLFARSAGDDKAPIIALMAAFDALKMAGIEPKANIKLFLDGEEEAGSPTLAQVLKENSNLFEADLMLFCDGPMHQSRKLQLVFGVRGAMALELTSYGPNRPLHSGHYGNWAPNPIDDLVHLLATLRDRDGNILVYGYQDDVTPISKAERAAIQAMPLIDSVLKDELAIGRTEGSERIELQLMEPAIVIRGIQAGGVGSLARNIILPSATASINLRLVPGQTQKRVRELLNAHFRSQGYFLVFDEPDVETLKRHERVLFVNWGSGGGYPAFRTALDGPATKKIAEILETGTGTAPLMTPTMGGSLPIYLFEDYVKAPIILLPIANHDNNQHGRNENIRLQNLWDAIEIYSLVIAGW